MIRSLYRRKHRSMREGFQDAGKWFTVDLDINEAEKLKAYLRQKGIKFKTRMVGNLVRFELFALEGDAEETDEFLDKEIK